jgi:PAS domain S-box-containing protein
MPCARYTIDAQGGDKLQKPPEARKDPTARGKPAAAIDSDTLDRSADALSLNENGFRALAETIPAAVFLHTDTVTTYVNAAAERLSGYTREELLGVTDFWRLVHPDSRAQLMEMYAAHKRGQEIPTEYEVKIVDKSGEVRWVQFKFDWVEIEPGRRDMLGTAFDITARKEAEDALKQSEARYRALYMDNPSMYFTLSADGDVLSVNDFGAGQLGYTVEELEGSSVLGVFHPEDRDLVTRQLAACLANPDQTAAWQLRKIRKDGSVIWVEERARATRDAAGREMVLVVCEDITERHRVEANLRESESRLSAFARAVPDIAFILDEGGLYVEVLGLEQRSDLLYGDASLMKGKRLHDVLPQEIADVFHAVITATIQTGETQVLEYELDVPAGHVWFEGRTSPLVLPDAPPMVVWLAQNITARKKAEQELVKLREELDLGAERAIVRGNSRGLTFRELTVLQLVVAGKSDKEVSVALGISPLTASKHVGNILRKMDAASRTEASVTAVREGLVS